MVTFLKKFIPVTDQHSSISSSQYNVEFGEALCGRSLKEGERQSSESLHTLKRAPMVLRIIMAAMDTTVLVSPWSQFSLVHQSEDMGYKEEEYHVHALSADTTGFMTGRFWKARSFVY